MTATRRLAWVDATAGVAGDMMLAAFVDAGADPLAVRRDVAAVLPQVGLDFVEVSRAGLRALRAEVRLLAPEQPHRSATDVVDLIRRATLPAAVTQSALAVFTRLAEVEARQHGVPVGEVRFHEVGAWDSLADVVGVCSAIHLLGIETVLCSSVALGSGTVDGAHRQLPVPVPVPVPAVLDLFAGWDVHGGGDGELATPTGAALLTVLAQEQGTLPRLRLAAVGVGAGRRDPPRRANVVRVIVVQTDTGVPPDADQKPTGTGEQDLVDQGPCQRALDQPGLDERDLVVLETNVDDLDPRLWPGVLQALLDGGGADAWLTRS